jgi:hypothetical protein
VHRETMGTDGPRPGAARLLFGHELRNRRTSIDLGPALAVSAATGQVDA